MAGRYVLREGVALQAERRVGRRPDGTWFPLDEFVMVKVADKPGSYRVGVRFFEAITMPEEDQGKEGERADVVRAVARLGETVDALVAQIAAMRERLLGASEVTPNPSVEG